MACATATYRLFALLFTMKSSSLEYQQKSKEKMLLGSWIDCFVILFELDDFQFPIPQRKFGTKNNRLCVQRSNNLIPHQIDEHTLVLSRDWQKKSISFSRRKIEFLVYDFGINVRV